MSSTERYFEETISPLSESIISRISEFIEKCKSRNMPLALVSSGGTIAPLEEQMIRYLDNFSAGTRGALSAEQFLENGYSVLFLYRMYSYVPYEIRFPLNLLHYFNGTQLKEESQIVHYYHLYNKALNENRLLLVPFTTIHDYLFLLRESCLLLNAMKRQVLLYLAAAVSDFYVPSSRLSPHKIQSSDATLLSLTLSPVPKILSHVKHVWCPEAYLVTFKLETDASLLDDKVKLSMEKYEPNLVIGNMLKTRKQRVDLYGKQSKRVIELTDLELASGKEIEGALVKKVIEFHFNYKE